MASRAFGMALRNTPANVSELSSNASLAELKELRDSLKGDIQRMDSIHQWRLRDEDRYAMRVTREDLTLVNSKLRKIESSRRSSQTDLIRSSAAVPVGKRELMNIFNFATLRKIAGVLEIRSTTKDETIDNILATEGHIEGVRAAINGMNDRDLRPLVKHFQRMGFIGDMKMNCKADEKRLAIKRTIYRLFVMDPSRRNPKRLGRAITERITGYLGKEIGSRARRKRVRRRRISSKKRSYKRRSSRRISSIKSSKRRRVKKGVTRKRKAKRGLFGFNF